VTLKEAITELTKQLGPRYSTPHTPFHNALKLGIEALKRLEDNRRDPEFDHWIPLPGETEE